MTETMEQQLNLFASLPALDDDALADAEFRAKDRAWAALIELYDNRKADDGLNYQILGDRIHRSRKQVHRWLSSPVNMTLGSIGLLAEGMDADLYMSVRPRDHSTSFSNYAHPSEIARSTIMMTYVTTQQTTSTVIAPLTKEKALSASNGIYSPQKVERVELAQ